MSDRPPHQDVLVEDVPAPIRLLGSMRVTQEQLAAAQRTRDYHLRKLQSLINQAQRGSEATANRQY